jgi:hypothetical protein
MIRTVSDPSIAAAPNHGSQTVAPDDGRNVRIANALRLRLEANYDEMEEKISVCEGAFALVDDVLFELHEKAQTAEMLQDALTRLEFHLQRSGAYYISDEQAQVIRARITEVGADKPRFCAYLASKVSTRSRFTGSTRPWPLSRQNAEGRHDTRSLSGGSGRHASSTPPMRSGAGG